MTKRSQILKQTCSFQIHVCLSMSELLVDIRHLRVNDMRMRGIKFFDECKLFLTDVVSLIKSIF